MKKPTKEKWFWEQCGFRYEDITDRHIWFTLVYPNGDKQTIWRPQPSIDLNNLKLYAFPLMDRISIYIDNEYLGKKRNKVRVMYKNSFYDGDSEHLEDAIFEAISESLGGAE